MSHFLWRRRAAVVVFTASVALAGCGDSPTEPDPIIEVAGTWKGSGSQAGGPLADVLDVEVVLTQDERALFGTYRLEFSPDPQYFIAGTAMGTVQPDNFTIDVKLTPTTWNRPVDVFACSMSGPVQFFSPPARLTGTLGGPGCPAIALDLRRE